MLLFVTKVTFFESKISKDNRIFFSSTNHFISGMLKNTIMFNVSFISNHMRIIDVFKVFTQDEINTSLSLSDTYPNFV